VCSNDTRRSFSWNSNLTSPRFADIFKMGRKMKQLQKKKRVVPIQLCSPGRGPSEWSKAKSEVVGLRVASKNIPIPKRGRLAGPVNTQPESRFFPQPRQCAPTGHAQLRGESPSQNVNQDGNQFAVRSEETVVSMSSSRQDRLVVCNFCLSSSLFSPLGWTSANGYYPESVL
jgi:hypothetical protein